MPFTKFANLDFDQIKSSIRDYLRANSTFSDFDFEGSNFSILIDTLAYNTYITAFNSNMIVNESFLDSATLRENVVSLARNIGYVPRSRTSAKAQVTFDIVLPDSSTDTFITLQRGIVCVGNANDTSYVFSIPENVTTTVRTDSVDGKKKARFTNLDIYQGTFLSAEFVYDGSLDQRFVLDNSFIDTSTIKVYIRKTNNIGEGTEYSPIDNIVGIDSDSRIYLLQEIQDEKYELKFGDGFIGKKLGDTGDGTIIRANYIVTDGPEGNGVNNFSFSGTVLSGKQTDNSSILGTIIGNVQYSDASGNSSKITTVQASTNGSDIESIESVKYYAPRLYASQYRAVTSRDYEAIIKRIYPDTESVSVIGGEQLNPPEYGNVLISIKPKNGTFVSDFNKERILSELKQYSISGINQKIIDLKILYVEIDSTIYYDDSKYSSSNNLKTKVTSVLNTYSKSLDLNKFGGRFKYSKLLRTIDNTDTSITSNITKVIIRRDLKAQINKLAQYELCFGNQFHVNSKGYNIKSTGFKISGESDTVYLTDIPNTDMKTGILSLVKEDSSGSEIVVLSSVGTVDYIAGEINLTTLNITSTDVENDIIEIQAFPESNDIVGLKDLYLKFDILKSEINILRDVISSGDEISGTSFVKDFYTSSYSNGNLKRT